MDTKVLFKNRSITSCMKAAYDYIGSHFTSLIKKTWWTTLIYAVLMAITILGSRKSHHVIPSANHHLCIDMAFVLSQ